jgi:hypothetical protein
VDMNLAFRDGEPEFVGASPRETGFHAAGVEWGPRGR